MEQRITDSVKSKSCYKINEQFLSSLVAILKNHDNSVKLLFDIWTDKKKYSTKTFEDLIDSASTIVTPINKIRISGNYPMQEKEYSTNQIKLSFSNYRNSFDQPNSTEIEYEFGTNINANKLASTLRQIIGIGVLLAFIVGLLINYTSSRLF